MAAMLNIVVVEDHDSLREATVDALQQHGHCVVGLDCAEALAELQSPSIDIIIIDLNLPGEDGISLSKRMKQTQPEIGIIMLTARTQVANKVLGYENGADIYLTKPTTAQELNAAVMSLARRVTTQQQSASTTLKLDLQHHTLTGSIQTIHLSPNETVILTAFVRAYGQQLETWQLMQLLGKSEQDYTKSALELCIVRLRKKLNAAGGQQKSIQAIREYGYKLCEYVQLI